MGGCIHFFAFFLSIEIWGPTTFLYFQPPQSPLAQAIGTYENATSLKSLWIYESE